MLPIQITLIIFFLIAIFKVVHQKRAGQLNFKGAAVWIVFWLLAIAVTINPDITSRVAILFGVGRGADVAVYAALALLFFVVFRLTVKIEQLNREVTKVVRQDALKDLDK